MPLGNVSLLFMTIYGTKMLKSGHTDQDVKTVKNLQHSPLLGHPYTRRSTLRNNTILYTGCPAGLDVHGATPRRITSYLHLS